MPDNEHVTDLDIRCKGLLPDRLYANFALAGAPDDDRRLALTAQDAGFDFHAWDWNRYSEARETAMKDLEERFLGTGMLAQDAERNASRVMAMCDMAAFHEQYQDSGRTDSVAMAFMMQDYETKVAIVEEKMSYHRTENESGLESGEDDDWIRTYFLSLMPDDALDILGMEDTCDSVMDVIGLDDEWTRLVFRSSDVAMKEFTDDGMLTDKGRMMLTMSFSNVCSACCTRNMMDQMTRDFSSKWIRALVGPVYDKKYKEYVDGGHDEVAANYAAVEASTTERRTLAYLWNKYGKDPAFLNSVQASDEPNPLRAVREYYMAVEVLPKTQEIVDAVRTHMDEVRIIKEKGNGGLLPKDYRQEVRGMGSDGKETVPVAHEPFSGPEDRGLDGLDEVGSSGEGHDGPQF